MYYHAKDLRRGRYPELNRPYLITTVTHNRNPIFKDFDIARLLIRELQITSVELRITSLAWVVMPDHLHWLFVFNHSLISEVARRVKGKALLRSTVIWVATQKSGKKAFTIMQSEKMKTSRP
jgi:REP element-mobilizing transposase RayT